MSRVVKVASFVFAASALLALFSAEPPCCATEPKSAARSAPAADRATMNALLKRYCFECHSGGEQKAEIDLEQLLRASPAKDHSGPWLRAWKIVRHEFMPPAGSDQPTPAERAALTAWIAGEMLGVDAASPDPGCVTLRRLNRLEYEYSVQDLFGLSLAVEQDYSSDVAVPGSNLLRLRDRLPPDETAFGFDNIGDFLTLPPALLERYFDIAEAVVERVVVLDGPRSPERRLTANDFVAKRDADRKRVEQSVRLTLPAAGKYRIDLQFTVGGWQDYGGAYDFAATIGAAQISRSRLEIGGYKKHAFTATIDLPAGEHALTLATEAVKPNARGKLEHLDLRPQATLAGPLGPEFAEYPEAHRRIFFEGPAPADPDRRRDYARRILQRVATRAFRRPVDSTTLDGLVELAEQSPRFEQGIAQALTAILTAPSFLFRRETQPQPNDSARVELLDEYALASRLSYFLWLSLPDDELLHEAAAGRLRQNLRAQVRRMLADNKSERFFEDFSGQWLRTRNVLMTPISTKSAGRLAAVRASLKQETDLLFEHVARNDRDLIELITADYTFVDRALADYYGLDGVPETGFHRVTLPADSHRGGILAHGSFLVAASNPNRTSPVKRGLFILENLLGIEPPPPPPNVPALDDVNLGDASKRTGRELLALHRADASCAACHAHFDPLGLALENYDLVGRWRDTEDGLPIDAAERTADGETVRGLADVQNYLLKRKPHFYRAVSEKLLTYALGRGLDPADSITIDRLVRQLEAGGGKFSDLLFGVLESPAFQQRRGYAGGTTTSTRNLVPAAPPPEKRRPPKSLEPPRPAPAENVVPSDAATDAPPLPKPR